MLLNRNGKLSIAFAMLMAINSSVFAENQANIIGISIGMTADQVKEALKKSGTSFKLIEGKYREQPGIPESLAFINACTAKPPQDGPGCYSPSGTANEQVLVAFGQLSGKAFYVDRTWTPAKDAQPLGSTVETAVLEKYPGLKKHMQSGSEGRLTGKSYSDAKDLSGRQEPQCGAPLGMSSKIPNSARSNCGFVAYAGLSFEIESQRLSGMYLALFDHRVLLEDIKRANEIRSSEANKKRTEEENAARKVSAPKL